MSWALRRRVVALGALAAVVSACGLPTDTRARPVEQAKLPPLLAAPTGTAAEPSTSLAGTIHTAYAVWYIGAGQLVPAERMLELGAPYAELIEVLAAGPTEEETTTEGWRSVVAAGTVVGVSLSGGVATIDLAPTFSEVAAADQILGVGQLVLTITEYPGIGQVRLTIGGEPIKIPLPDGTQVGRDVARDDFLALTTPR